MATISSSSVERKSLSPPSISSKSEAAASNTFPEDATFFAITPTSFDVRESFRLIGVLVVLSPLCLKFLTFQACVGAVVASCLIPIIIRLRYPRFMEANITDDLRLKAGFLMSLIASVTVVLLQTHNPKKSFTTKFHSEFYTCPLVPLLRTLLFLEIAYNGAPDEREQAASCLRWIHRDIQGEITEQMRKELGISNDIEAHGYVDELKAYIVCMLTWATIAFQTRFGRPLSKRAKDAIVLEYASMGSHTGIPEGLLSKDYESFLILLDKQLDVFDRGHSFDLTRTTVQNMETPILTAKMNFISKIMSKVALMIGFDLLPQRVRDNHQYQLKVLSTPFQRAIQKMLIAALWFFYPMLMWLPLRGAICLWLILEPQLMPVFTSSLQTIHSMDIVSDEPTYPNPDNERLTSMDSEDEFPSNVLWLDSGSMEGTFLQRLLVRFLRAKLMSSAQARLSVAWIAPWICLSANVAGITVDVIRRSIRDTAARWKTQIKESMIFGSDEIKIPRHSFVMDGNRRYARTIGQSVIVGHQRGAQTAGKILDWWVRFIPNTAAYTRPGLGPRYLTIWAFSAENFKRPKVEVDYLFRLMTFHFKNLAFASTLHLFQIRVRIVGSREKLPRELLDAIELLEDATRKYSRLFLQVAVGYGGRDEIVRSVRSVIARGAEVTEDSIGEGTFCSQIGIPPVELIVRTSERRTSGFFLWDTQTAELLFLDKLWPQLTEEDWLDAIGSFAQREIRNGR